MFSAAAARRRLPAPTCREARPGPLQRVGAGKHSSAHTHCCASAFTRCVEWPCPDRERIVSRLQDPGLLMTASREGKVLTYGWRWDNLSSLPDTGALQMMGVHSRTMPTSFPDRSVAVLPAALAALQHGKALLHPMIHVPL